MTTNCDLCGRGMAKKAFTPTWWPYTVCERKRCLHAARDAITAVDTDRDHHDDLIRALRVRHQDAVMPVGWRDDAMARIDVVEGREWWANGIAKSV